MSLLHIHGLPRDTNKSELFGMLLDTREVRKPQIGRIGLGDDDITIELPDTIGPRVAGALSDARLGGRRVDAWWETEPDPRDAKHFKKLLRFVDLEGAAESQRAKAVEGGDAQTRRTDISVGLCNLVSTTQHIGIGGRLYIRLAKAGGKPLPRSELTVGSPVVLVAESVDERRTTGIVNEVTGDAIEIAIPGSIKWLTPDVTCRLQLGTDEVSRRRERLALRRAQQTSSGDAGRLREVLLQRQEAAFAESALVVPFDAGLNAAQLDAVQFALAARELAIIHGPPGTGKTRTLAELIRQAVKRGDRVLATAPSNMGIDNLFGRLVAAGVSAIRVGHPARVLPHLQRNTLSAFADRHADTKAASRLRRDADTLLRKADGDGDSRSSRESREARDQGRQLIGEARRLEADAIEQILSSADVICATNTGLDSRLLGPRHFGLVVIDEAAQSTETAAWIPVLRAQRVVLAGDHCQLPPTVLSSEAKRQGYGISLMERLVMWRGPVLSRQLVQQYRMHAHIMGFSSTEFYDGTLVADAGVAEHLLTELDGVDDDELTNTAVEFIDTSGAEYLEAAEPGGLSLLNTGEAQIVDAVVQRLIDVHVSVDDIAVIAPYSAQVRHLTERLGRADLEISTVDGFQGREKPVIIISLTRCNVEHEIGFLSDYRRINVALTRAQRKLIVIGDSATLGGTPFYDRLLDYFDTVGAYHTVWEYA